MSEPKIFSEGAPGDAMDRAWTVSGCSCVVDCVCGRTHFVGRGALHGHYEEGELVALEASAEKNPEQYVEINDYDSIDVGYLNGEQVVLGCPCNALAPFERFLLGHRWQILKFYQLKAEEAAKRATYAAEIAAGVAGAIEVAGDAKFLEGGEPAAASEVERIALGVAEHFRTFGGGRTAGADLNPLVGWLKDRPAEFAAGVDVAEVVRFVLAATKAGGPS